MNELNFTALQQQRYDRALEEYWKDPAHVTYRNDPLFKEKLLHESVRLATLAARAHVMSDDEFKKATSELYNLGLESGDVGGEFYTRVIANLKELRKLPH